jgi:hypothetical protein
MQVFDVSLFPAALDAPAQLDGQFTLLRQGLGQYSPPFLEFTVINHAILNGADIGFVQASSCFFAEADYKGGGSSSFQEREGGRDRAFG